MPLFFLLMLYQNSTIVVITNTKGLKVMPVLTGKIKTDRTEAGTKAALQHAISKRILELDGDIRTLKERREWAWLPIKEINQYNRLIKLFEKTIEELQAAL